MRIPTYRGQAQITTQAPGQSFTARKNPNPFVQQALAKGNMQAELFSQAASYAATQRKIKVEARKNEAILGAKEAMMQLSDAFLNDNQPYDIFEPDGTGRWDKETKDIKNKLRSKIGTDRYALAAFDTAFAQAELPLRFQLKGQIDTKIEKMHVASVNEGWEDFIFKYSDPNVNTTTFDIDFADEADKTSKAVELGAFEKDVMSELPNNVLKRIATDLIPAYTGRDLEKTLNLMENFELLQEVEAGEATIEDLNTNIPQHVLNVLSKVSTSDAQKILSTSLTQAMQAVNAQQEVQKTQENRRKFILESVTNRFQYYSSKLGDEQITADQLSETDRLVPGLQKLAETGGVINATQAQEFIKDFLYERNAVTSTIKKVFDDAAEVVTTPYAGESLPGIYDSLFNKLTFGDLSQKELEDNKPYLDKEDYGFLANGIDNKRSEQLRQSENVQTSDQTRANAAFTAALNSSKGLYSYDELTADDEDLGDLKRAAYFAVFDGLNSFKLKTLVDGTEFSPATISGELQRLLKENEQVFKLEAIDNYETFLGSNKVTKYPDLKLTTVNPFKTLDDWYASQDTDLGTPGVQVNKFLEKEYGRIKERLKEFNKFGIFQ